VEKACEMKGNFWIVVMTMGVPFDSARASHRVARRPLAGNFERHGLPICSASQLL
jgi:hypothetical protein